jgi:hypothetical protein
MQNFKSFLKEETLQNKSYYNIEFKLSSNVIDETEYMKRNSSIKKKYSEILMDLIKEYYPEIVSYIKDVDYLYIVKSISFNIYIDKNDAIDLEILKEKLSPIVKEFFNSDNYTIICKAWLQDIEQQDFLVKCNEIGILFDKNGNCSLRGIAKKIDCEELQTWYADTIDEGGLGLLQLKTLKNVINRTIGEPEWLKIVKKHLQTKDILDCQEELITNKLKEYAKL